MESKKYVKTFIVIILYQAKHTCIHRLIDKEHHDYRILLLKLTLITRNLEPKHRKNYKKSYTYVNKFLINAHSSLNIITTANLLPYILK